MKAVIFAPILFGLVATPAFAQDKKAESKKVRFELVKTQHIVVDVKVNGKGAFRLIFDTGAPAMVIDNELAKAAGVIDKNAKRPGFAPFGMEATPLKMKTFELGELKVE